MSPNDARDFAQRAQEELYKMRVTHESKGVLDITWEDIDWIFSEVSIEVQGIHRPLHATDEGGEVRFREFARGIEDAKESCMCSDMREVLERVYNMTDMILEYEFWWSFWMGHPRLTAMNARANANLIAYRVEQLVSDPRLPTHEEAASLASQKGEC